MNCKYTLNGCPTAPSAPTGFQLGWRWLVGSLPSTIYYGSKSPGTRDMMRSTVVGRLRQQYISQGCPSEVTVNSGHLEPWKESARNLVVANPTQFQVGGFREIFSTNRDRSTTSYTIWNVVGWSSLSGESTWGPHLGMKDDALDTQGGVGHNVLQLFVWSEANPCGR